MPHPKGIELSVPIGDALKTIQHALAPRRFSPADAHWAFKLAFSDQASIVVLPRLLRRLAEVAPHVTLRIEPKWNATVQAQLDAAEIDLAVGIIPNLPRRFAGSTLFEDRYVCMMRKDHPLAGRPITQAQFSAAEHVAVRPSLDRASQIDQTLNRLGGARKVVLNVNQFLSVPSVLMETNLIACLLRSVSHHFDQSRFYFCPLPFSYDPMSVVVTWTRARTEDAANSWMRKQLADACQDLRQQGRPAPRHARDGTGKPQAYHSGGSGRREP